LHTPSNRLAAADSGQDHAHALRALRSALAAGASAARRFDLDDERQLCQAMADALQDATGAAHAVVLVRAGGLLRLAAVRGNGAQLGGTRLEADARRLLDDLAAGELREVRLDGIGMAAIPLAADGREVIGVLCVAIDGDTRFDPAALAGLAATGAARLAGLRAVAADDVPTNVPAIAPADADAHEFDAHTILPGPLADEGGLLRTLIDNMPDQIYAKDCHGRFLIANKAAALMILGRPDSAALIGKSDLDFYPLECGQRFFTDEQAIIRSGLPIVDQVEENLSKDGVLRFYSTTKFPFRDESGNVGGIVGISRDITLRVGADEAARLRERAVESSQDGILITCCLSHDHPVVYTNPAFERITGFKLQDAKAAGIERFLLEVDERVEGAHTAHARDALIARHGDRRVLRAVRKDGSQYWSEVRLAVIRSASGAATHHVFTVTDVTDAHRAEEALTLLASHDPLTGLPNRRMLMARLAQATAAVDGGELQLAVAFIDLDGLKRLNDEHGHEAGDMLLRTVAQRINACIRQSDTIARLGGDEFVLVTLHRTGRASGDAGGVAEVVQKIQERIAQPIGIGDVVVQATCSIGVSLFGRHGTDPDTLLRRADEAMYVAKKTGRNRIVFAGDGGGT
jgi:diguanylate cyclase (GGDEF)-like protein/PAS domain S-box-containing protein